MILGFGTGTALVAQNRCTALHSTVFWIHGSSHCYGYVERKNISTDVVVQRVLQVASVMILLSLFWMHPTNTRKVRHATLSMAWYTNVCLVGMTRPFLRAGAR